MDLGNVSQNPSGKDSSLQIPLRTFCDSQEDVKISTLTGVGKKWILIPKDDFEEFKTSMEEVAAGAVAMELEVGPEM